MNLCENSPRVYTQETDSQVIGHMPTFTKSHQTALLNGFASLHPHQEGRRVPSSMPLGICLLSYCAAVLMDRWQLRASLCISLDRKVSELCFQSELFRFLLV